MTIGRPRRLSNASRSSLVTSVHLALFEVQHCLCILAVRSGFRPYDYLSSSFIWRFMSKSARRQDSASQLLSVCFLLFPLLLLLLLLFCELGTGYALLYGNSSCLAGMWMMISEPRGLGSPHHHHSASELCCFSLNCSHTITYLLRLNHPSQLRYNERRRLLHLSDDRSLKQVTHGLQTAQLISVPR